MPESVVGLNGRRNLLQQSMMAGEGPAPAYSPFAVAVAAAETSRMLVPNSVEDDVLRLSHRLLVRGNSSLRLSQTAHSLDKFSRVVLRGADTGLWIGPQDLVQNGFGLYPFEGAAAPHANLATKIASLCYEPVLMAAGTGDLVMVEDGSVAIVFTTEAPLLDPDPTNGTTADRTLAVDTAMLFDLML